MATIHKISRVRAAGKYCEFWLSPPLGEGASFCMCAKWDEVQNMVHEGALEDHILNSGYVGLRLVLERGAHGCWRPIAITTGRKEETDVP